MWPTAAYVLTAQQMTAHIYADYHGTNAQDLMDPPNTQLLATVGALHPRQTPAHSCAAHVQTAVAANPPTAPSGATPKEE